MNATTLVDTNFLARALKLKLEPMLKNFEIYYTLKTEEEGSLEYSFVFQHLTLKGLSFEWQHFITARVVSEFNRGSGLDKYLEDLVNRTLCEAVLGVMITGDYDKGNHLNTNILYHYDSYNKEWAEHTASEVIDKTGKLLVK